MASNDITPSSVINFLIKKAFFVASEAAMHLASIVESVMIDCLELFQLINSSLHRNTHLDIDFLSPTSNIKSESVYHSTLNSDPPLKIKNISLVFLKYLKIFFIAI